MVSVPNPGLIPKGLMAKSKASSKGSSTLGPVQSVANFFAPPAYLNDAHLIHYAKSVLPATPLPQRPARTVGPGMSHGGGGGLAGNGKDQPTQPKPITKPKPVKGTPGRGNASATPTKPLPPNTSVAPGSTPSTKPVRTTAGKGGGGGGGGGSSLGGMSIAAMQAAARKLAQQETDAMSQPYTDAISQQQAQTKAHDAAIQNLTSALQSYLLPQGQKTSGISDMYGHAADAIAGYAKGYSDQAGQLKTDAGAESAANPNLTAAQQGEITSAFSGVPTDVMYGVHGANPATTARMLGTGLQTAYNTGIPRQISGMGQQFLASNADAGLKNVQQLQTSLAEQKAKYPSLYSQAFTTFSDQNMKAQSLAATLYAEGIRNRATVAGITGYDPVTGMPTAATQRSNASLQKVDTTMSKAYQVQMNSEGQVIVGKNGKPIPYPGGNGSAPKVNTTLSKWYGILVDNTGKPIKNGDGKYIPVPQQANDGQYHGLKKPAYEKLASQALGLARIGHKEITDSKNVTHPAVSWQVYLDGALSKKIPMWIIIEQGKRVYSQAEIDQGLIPGQGSDVPNG